MKHSISISVLNSAVGIPPSADGVMMMFIKGVAIANTLQLDKAYLLTQLSDATALGINAAYDVTNSTAVYQQINEFYIEAGAGALLWLVVTTKTANPFATYVASATFASLIKYTAAANPLNRAKMIGLCYDVPATTQLATDFPADVTATILALQTTQKQLFALGYQFSGIVDGYNMSTAVTPSTIGTRATDAAQQVSCCITGTLGNGVSAVGKALGRFARISIGHGFGEVADGPISTSTAYLTNSILVPTTGTLIVGRTYLVQGGTVLYNAVTYQAGSSFVAVIGHTTYTTADTGYVLENGTPVQSLNYPTDYDALGSSQYMFLRTWFEHNGFYWNDGATCSDPTLILSSQEYCRVANALAADALSFFIDEMGKNLPLDTKTGNLDQTYCNGKQSQFYDQYIGPLTVASGSGDITDGQIVITGVNFLATKTVNFVITVVPTVILGSVVGTIEFAATL